jgi:hypothetical protein
MTRDLPAVVALSIPRLGSPFDGEVVATARAIERGCVPTAWIGTI